ncbi:hypothetical protein Hanom_Chr04g00292341 [Helianthus anomalus]
MDIKDRLGLMKVKKKKKKISSYKFQVDQPNVINTLFTPLKTTHPPTHFDWIPLFNRVPTTVNHHHHQQRPHQQRPKSQMGFFSFLGRLFFASLFILSAWQIFICESEIGWCHCLGIRGSKAIHTHTHLVLKSERRIKATRSKTKAQSAIAAGFFVPEVQANYIYFFTYHT